MCLNHDSDGRSCSRCQECAAVETLLSFSQATAGQKVKSRKRSLTADKHNTAVLSEVCPPTPPPSDAGSLSPLSQTEDSCEACDMIQETVAPPKKTSKLAQVKIV